MSLDILRREYVIVKHKGKTQKQTYHVVQVSRSPTSDLDQFRVKTKTLTCCNVAKILETPQESTATS